MTHTLHRYGAIDTLKNDFVVLIMASQNLNTKGSKEKYRKFVNEAINHGAIKIGDAKNGNIVTQGGKQNLINSIEDQGAPLHAVFDEYDNFVRFIEYLKKADLGLSVTVSAESTKIRDACKKMGLVVHTAEHSLGFWGNTSRLPSEDILEIQTMCGHGMVTVQMIEKEIEEVLKLKKTSGEAAESLYKNCTCGIFNTTRASMLLKKIKEKNQG